MEKRPDTPVGTALTRVVWVHLTTPITFAIDGAVSRNDAPFTLLFTPFACSRLTLGVFASGRTWLADPVETSVGSGLFGALYHRAPVAIRARCAIVYVALLTPHGPVCGEHTRTCGALSVEGRAVLCRQAFSGDALSCAIADGLTSACAALVVVFAGQASPRDTAVGRALDVGHAALLAALCLADAPVSQAAGDTVCVAATPSAVMLVTDLSRHAIGVGEALPFDADLGGCVADPICSALGAVGAAHTVVVDTEVGPAGGDLG